MKEAIAVACRIYELGEIGHHELVEGAAAGALQLYSVG